ncbi:MAG: gfo/Idh/MocA family oxidoreductase, partial [Planctomycetia bacterium]|nr:gfo/Idh/MocA family oxidoreductase [Planctomycetia bacterium]
MSRVGRRRFLAATGTLALVGRPVRMVPAADPPTGPGDTVRVGAIGVGWRASLLLEQLPAGATIVALCDVN